MGVDNQMKPINPSLHRRAMFQLQTFEERDPC